MRSCSCKLEQVSTQCILYTHTHIYFAYTNVIKILFLRLRIDINACNILQRTPLHCTAVSGRVDIALLLLRAGAQLKPCDAHGWEPQQLAEMFAHRDLQELLLREGMTEKQAVMKELPPMPWHSEVWFEVVKMQQNKRAEHERSLRV
ncbi:ankyrin repeat domain-containing protein, partial [archaeon]